MSGVQVILVTGGCRSGKSRYALEEAEKLSGPRVFIATCPRIDGEMDERIARHRRERDAKVWRTVEEPLRLEEVFASLGAGEAAVVLVDCVSLWVNNLMHEAEHRAFALTEDQVAERTRGVLRAARGLPAGSSVFFTTSEVGLGVVPESRSGRRYRDFLGWANQEIARESDSATLLVSGLPFRLK